MVMNNSDMADILIALGKRIKSVRLSKLISQTDLSISSEINKSTLSRIENGNVNISYLTLCRIAISLNVPVQDLTHTNSNNYDQIKEGDQYIPGK
jgi:transcriptional regulator with XRE-family HTH domain